jgi:dihydrofolate reductase
VRVSLVAAVANGGVIGRDGGIPWHLSNDLARFRELTTGHAVVMGRRTWDSLPDRFRPLPDRRNVVVTRDPGWHAEGAERAGSVEEALALLADAPRVFVIGGAEIYAASLPLADELVLTEVDLEVEGDTVFPPFDRAALVETAREAHVSESGIRFAFVTYERRGTPRRVDRAGVEQAAWPLVTDDPHTSRDALDAHLPDLRALPSDQGTLALIVVRPTEGERKTPSTAELTTEDGLVGDRWRTTRTLTRPDGSVDPDNQLTLMSSRVLGLIAARDRWPIAGDNLVVDMGLDAEGLPVGARLAIGPAAVVEISEEPHTGCAKFSARFGSDALKFVNSPEGRALRLRGVNAKVVVPGTVSTGDAIRRL